MVKLICSFNTAVTFSESAAVSASVCAKPAAQIPGENLVMNSHLPLTCTVFLQPKHFSLHHSKFLDVVMGECSITPNL